MEYKDYVSEISNADNPPFLYYMLEELDSDTEISNHEKNTLAEMATSRSKDLYADHLVKIIRREASMCKKRDQLKKLIPLVEDYPYKESCEYYYLKYLLLAISYQLQE